MARQTTPSWLMRESIKLTDDGARGSRRWVVGAVCAWAIVGAVGCSVPLDMILFNGTSGPISVHLWKRTLVIEPEKSARFHYPQTDGRSNEPWWPLRISAEGCEIVYEPPSPRLIQHVPRPPHPWSPMKAQIESDQTIYLLPWEAKNIADVASLRSIQMDGFPLRAKSRSCR